MRHLPLAVPGDTKSRLSFGVPWKGGPLNPAVRDRLCLLSGAKSRRLKHDAVISPGARHPHGQAGDSAAACPQRAWHGFFRRVKTGAQILTDVRIAYATDAF